MSIVERIHERHVYNRRVRVLADRLAEILPRDARVLDVGCGDGLIDRLILDRRPDLQIEGIDVLRRARTHIPVKTFDGQSLPLPPDAVDVVLFVDVLHHTRDIRGLLGEARRVARAHLALKDHLVSGMLARPTLRFMDAVGNARFGVSLPYNYWTRTQWDAAFAELGLTAESWREDLHLYPPWADWLFGRSLHFLALLGKSTPPTTV
jgi:SAM-dependent methyltransferase